MGTPNWLISKFSSLQDIVHHANIIFLQRLKCNLLFELEAITCSLYGLCIKAKQR